MDIPKNFRWDAERPGAGFQKIFQMDVYKFAGRSGSEPIGVLDLGYGSWVDLVDPPQTPPVGTPGT